MVAYELTKREILKEIDIWGLTRVMNDLEAAEILIERDKIDLEWICTHFNEEGQTILHFALEKGNYAVIEVLMKINGLDLRIKNKKGQTALRLAHSFKKKYPAHKKFLKDLKKKRKDTRSLPRQK